jgi:23S rRNA pseudouridine1911/1915/1917 synthase
MKYNFCVITEKKIRVDMYLSALFEEFSRSYIQKMIDSGQLLVNWIILRKNTKISNRDEILLEIVTIKLEEVKPEKMDLDIIFEDDGILVLNKNPGTNVHPVPWEGWKSSTLVNWVLDHCKEKLPTINWVERPWIVHRLDKDTSGAIMIAKNDKMMSYLSESIKQKKVWKYYLAIVSWILTKDNFKIESYIGRDPNDRKKMTLKNPVNPKLAVTFGKVLKHIDSKYSLIMLKLETWRTHQIRVHLSSIGYPIIGDRTYWNSKVNKTATTLFQLKRQALHAYFIEIDLFWKPMKFVAELKDDMKKIIREDVKTEF